MCDVKGTVACRTAGELSASQHASPGIVIVGPSSLCPRHGIIVMLRTMMTGHYHRTVITATPSTPTIPPSPYYHCIVTFSCMHTGSLLACIEDLKLVFYRALAAFHRSLSLLFVLSAPKPEANDKGRARADSRHVNRCLL